MSDEPATGDATVDTDHLRRAIDLAREAAEAGNTPFGSLLTRDGVVVAEARNTTRTDDDVTAHPELKLARQAAREFEAPGGLTMYTSTEPCPMCAGAMYHAGLRRVVYATSAEQVAAAAGGGGLVMPCAAVFEHASEPVETVGPRLAEECLTLHDAFW